MRSENSKKTAEGDLSKDTKEYKVSVIVTAYNNEAYIGKAVKSVLDQTLKEIEIIAVDDGSTDGTPQILDELASGDSRLKVIHKENTGHGHSFNVALDMANGEYIGNLDGDDYMESDMLEAYYTVAKTMGAEVVKGDYIRFYGENGQEKEQYCKCPQVDGVYYRRLNPQKLEKATFRSAHMIWTGIYQRDFLNKYRIRCNEAYKATYDDNGFAFRVLCNCTKMVFTDQIGCHYRTDNPNSSVRKCNSYAMEREFGYIYDYVKSNESFHGFLPVYWYYYVLNCLFILSGIDRALLHDYLLHISEVLKGASKRGELQSFCFREEGWNNVKMIMETPSELEKRILGSKNRD